MLTLQVVSSVGGVSGLARKKVNAMHRPIICPSVTPTDLTQYREQLHKVFKLTNRIHLDFMDGSMTDTNSPDLRDINMPKHMEIDLHIMYQDPMEHLRQIIKLRPHLVIIHAEAHLHHMHFAAELHKEDIKVGLAILPETPFGNIDQVVSSFDHALIFSGHLGHFGGQADLSLLDKVKSLKEHHPEIEIGWDGGINEENARDLAEGGVDVLNVGGFIQGADNPKQAYLQLVGAVHATNR